MRKDPETYQHLQQLLDKLKTGNLTSSERDELYQLSINDPFLKDAIEGYGQFPEVDHQASIDRLKSKVKSLQSEKKHRIRPFWLKAAAVALIISIGGWLFWGSLFQQDKTQFAAQTENEVEIKPPVLVQTDEEDSYAINESEEMLESDQPLNTTPSSPGSVRKEEKEKTETSADNQISLLEELFVQDSSLHIASAPPEQDNIVTEEVSIPGSDKDLDANSAGAQPANQVERSKVVSAESNEMIDQESRPDSRVFNPASADVQRLKSYSNAMSQIDLRRTIIGTVMDQEGTPLIGANVMEKGTKNGAITDLDGRFSITIQDTQNSVVISFLGFDENEIPPTLLGQNIQVQLIENPEILDEVIVGAYSKKSRRQEQKEIYDERTILAEPTKGLKKFKRYIKENALYPSGHSNKTIDGIVTVRFQLNADGTPLSVEIVSSFNRIFNAEAIRLIRQGGAWQTKPKGQSGWIEYDVQF
jgi:TonB family protein